MLNLTQSPEELDAIYGSDFYWYLSSPAFVEAFVKPLSDAARKAGCQSLLDVGCGQGILGDHFAGRYAGFDTSQVAIDRGRLRNPQLDLRIGRIEKPEFLLPAKFDAIVFGGLLSVIVKPEFYIDFIRLYSIFDPKIFVVYDLERVDTTEIDATFDRIAKCHGSANVELEPEVKKHRKILVYKWS